MIQGRRGWIIVSCFSNRDRLSSGGVGKFLILIAGAVVIIAVLLPVVSLFLSCGICDSLQNMYG